MFTVVLALIPAASAGVVFFGMRALLHMILSIAAAVLTEFFCKDYYEKK
jgi:Na+-translocating ferredoxin:NAD+ oxidoreductase RnfD subunit